MLTSPRALLSFLMALALALTLALFSPSSATAKPRPALTFPPAGTVCSTPYQTQELVQITDGVYEVASVDWHGSCTSGPGTTYRMRVKVHYSTLVTKTYVTGYVAYGTPQTVHIDDPDWFSYDAEVWYYANTGAVLGHYNL